MEKLYKEWIQYLFNRPETEWYWDFGLKAFEASNEELARLVSQPPFRSPPVIGTFPAL